MNAKAALMKQIHTLADNDPDVGDPEAEVSRVKALVIKNSSGKVKVSFPFSSRVPVSTYIHVFLYPSFLMFF